MSGPIHIPITVEPSPELLGAVAELRELCFRAERVAERIEAFEAKHMNAPTFTIRADVDENELLAKLRAIRDSAPPSKIESYNADDIALRGDQP